MAQQLLRFLPADSFIAAAFGAAVAIPSETATGLEQGRRAWLQAAYEGEFKGYRFPVKLTRGVFDSIVSNLRKDPQFKAGEDGYGAQPVVRMDYEHASAMPPSEGSIPSLGVPAPGWVCDAEVRTGKGGRGELWCLCELGETLSNQIKAGEQRFLSIDAPLKAKDPVTDADIGPKLRALAVTNDPFLRDLQPMRVAASMSQYGPAESPEELVIGLRQALELPEAATPQDISAAITALGAAFEADARPPGFPDGLGCVLDAIRRLVGLPLLATADQIVEGAGQALTALSASTSTQATTPPGEPPTMAATTALSAKLSLLFNCADDETAILAAATKASGGLAALSDLMKQYGASDASDLATKAGTARDQAAKAAEFATKLSEALAALDTGAEQEATGEAEQIAASMGFKKEDPRGTGARSLIFALGHAARRAALGIELGANGPDGKPMLTICKKDPAKLVEFRQQYPLPTAEQQRAVLLTTPIVAGPTAQLGGAHTGLTAGGAQPTDKPAHIVALAAYEGRNDIERAIAMLNAKQDGFKDRSWADKCRMAGNFIKTGSIAA